MGFKGASITPLKGRIKTSEAAEIKSLLGEATAGHRGWPKRVIHLWNMDEYRDMMGISYIYIIYKIIYIYII